MEGRKPHVVVAKFGGKTACVERPRRNGGGSSLATVKRIVRQIVKGGSKVVLPVSAYANTTNELETLQKMLISGELRKPEHIRGYLNDRIFESHSKLASDLILNPHKINRLLSKHVDQIVKRSEQFLEAKSKLKLEDSILGLYSPALWMQEGADVYRNKGEVSRKTQDRWHDTKYVWQMGTCLDDIITRGERIMVEFYRKYLDKNRRVFGTPRAVFAEDVFVTSDDLGHATIDVKKSVKKGRSSLLPLLNNPKVKVIVVPGFYGAYVSGEIRCFGRGGSDLTAVALGYLLKQYRSLEVDDPVLTKDTRAIMAVNPKAVYCSDSSKLPILASLGDIANFDWVDCSKIPTIPNLHYGDAKEISAVHTGAVQFAQQYGINIEIRNVNKYFSSTKSIISGERTSNGMKLIGGTEKAMLLEMQGKCRDLPGEALWMSLPFYQFNINLAKFIHYIGDTLILATGGTENIEGAIALLKDTFGPITCTDSSQIRVTGNVDFGHRQALDKLSRQATSSTLGPWRETYRTLSNIFPRFGSKIPIDYYKGIMTMTYMLYYGNKQHAWALAGELGKIAKQYRGK